MKTLDPVAVAAQQLEVWSLIAPQDAVGDLDDGVLAHGPDGRSAAFNMVEVEDTKISDAAVGALAAHLGHRFTLDPLVPDGPSIPGPLALAVGLGGFPAAGLAPRLEAIGRLGAPMELSDGLLLVALPALFQHTSDLTKATKKEVEDDE